MMKHAAGNTSPNPDPDTDPIPDWRRALYTATPTEMIKLLVDISSWAKEHPRSVTALTLQGDAYLRIKQPYAAEKSYRQALSQSLNHAPAREGLGLALLQTNDPSEAAKHLAIAHALDPDNAEVLVHWGLALVQLKNLKAAHNRFQMALDRAPDNAYACLNLGLVDTHRGAWNTAIGHFKNAIQLKPDLSEALHNLALAYRHIGQLDNALHSASELAKMHPTHAQNWVLLAELYVNQGQLTKANDALQRALHADPSNENIYLTRAMTFSALRQYTDAEGALKTALALSRDIPDIQLEMGHLHLLQQRFGSGWDLHESRKKITQSPVRRFPLKDWTGEELSGKTVLVHAEQGLGDTIMFANCIPDIISRAAHVVIEVSTRLAQIFERSFPEATVIGRDPQAVDLTWLNQLPFSIDYQIPIGSLPKHFRRDIRQFPSHRGYLKANPERVAQWRSRLSQFGRPVIGLAWQGGLVQTGREQRSIELAAWASTLASTKVQWVSLQYGPRAERDAAEASRLGLDLPHWEETLANQDEVAALTCALDGIATVCSTQAHLTGALGQHGWVLTPFSPNWRYGAEGDRMPWYPSLHLLRQTVSGDWSGPIAALQSHIAAIDNSCSQTINT